MEGLSERIGKIIDTSTVQKLTDKLHNTNYEFNMMALTDIIATGIFMHQTAKSKGIEQDRKKLLCIIPQSQLACVSVAVI